MIPASITSEHIKTAIAHIRQHGIPSERASTGYDLLHQGRLYPPKYVLSLASKFATGEELPAKEFFGGEETNSFLAGKGFVTRPKGKDWSEAECYFAVWAYDQLDIDRSIVKRELYREISNIIGRSEKSVEFKVQNVSSFDPRPRAEKPIAEAPNAQRLLGNVFSWYWQHREKARELHTGYYEQFSFLLVPEDKKDGPYTSPTAPTFLIEEGAPALASGYKRKRSQKLIDKGREHFKRLEADGKLRCRACGFTAPDGIGAEIIHLHHVEPISDAGATGRSLSFSEAINSLIPLCPTCHQIAHAGRPPFSAEVIRELRGI